MFVHDILQDDWRRWVILPFWKSKDDIHVWSNHCDITFHSFPESFLQVSDDIFLFASDLISLNEPLEIYIDEASKIGLSISYSKTSDGDKRYNTTAFNLSQRSTRGSCAPLHLSWLKDSSYFRHTFWNGTVSASDIIWRQGWSLSKHRNIINRNNKKNIQRMCHLGAPLWLGNMATYVQWLKNFDSRALRRVLGVVGKIT